VNIVAQVSDIQNVLITPESFTTGSISNYVFQLPLDY